MKCVGYCRISDNVIADNISLIGYWKIVINLKLILVFSGKHIRYDQTGIRQIHGYIRSDLFNT